MLLLLLGLAALLPPGVAAVVVQGRQAYSCCLGRTSN
jgi:hypothetical protein